MFFLCRLLMCVCVCFFTFSHSSQIWLLFTYSVLWLAQKLPVASWIVGKLEPGNNLSEIKWEASHPGSVAHSIAWIHTHFHSEVLGEGGTRDTDWVG